MCFVVFPTFPQGGESPTLITRRKPNEMRVLTSLEAGLRAEKSPRGPFWRAEKSPRGPWGIVLRRVGSCIRTTSHTSQGSHSYPSTHLKMEHARVCDLYFSIWLYTRLSLAKCVETQLLQEPLGALGLASRSREEGGGVVEP